MLNEAKGMSSRADPSSCTAPEVRAPPRTHLIKAPHRTASKQMRFFFRLYIKGFFAQDGVSLAAALPKAENVDHT